MTKWRVLRLALVVLALALLAVLLARLGPRRIGAELASAGPAALWLLVAYAAGTTVGALPWHVLLPREARPPLRGTIASRFAASGANAIIPLLGVGGEPVRLLWVAREHHAAAVAGLILDRLTYVLASGLVLTAGAVIALPLIALPASYSAAAIAGALLLVASAPLVTWFLARRRAASRIHRLVHRLGKRARPDGPLFGERVDHELTAMLARRRSVALAIALGVGARLVLGLEVYAAFRVLGVRLPVSHAIVFASVPVLLSFFGAVIPSQLGIQEGSQALVASALGLSPAVAVAAVLLQRVRSLVTAAFAWGLAVARERRR